MNNARRKHLDEIYTKIEEIIADLESLRDEEREAFDAMPESLQQGEKGQQAEAAADALDSAVSSAEEVRDYIGEAKGA